MTEKGCDNCYYTYFDERAYPCSLCIRGIERTDQWQPSKKTKAEQTEPQCKTCKHYPPSKKWPCEDCCHKDRWEQTEPQTDEDCDYCKMTHKNWYEHCDICKRKPKDEPQTDCSWK